MDEDESTDDKENDYERKRTSRDVRDGNQVKLDTAHNTVRDGSKRRTDRTAETECVREMVRGFFL